MSKPVLLSIRHEALANLRLAWPLILAQLSFMGMGTVDTIMAGRLGADALAAVSVGTNVWLLAFVVFMGISMAIPPIVAQQLGAGAAADDIGRFVRVALRLGLVLGVLWIGLTWTVATVVLPWLDLQPTTRSMAQDYLRIVGLSGLPFVLCFVLRHVADAHGYTMLTLVAGSCGLLVNAVLDYALMFGKLGMPALGVAGAAWATVCAACTMVGVYLLLYRLIPTLHSLRIVAGSGAQWRQTSIHILRLGLPVAAILCAESWMFIGGSLVMARFGVEVVAAHQVALNVTALAFMVPMSIGMATTVRVGLAVGAGDLTTARLRSWIGVLAAVGWALLSAAIMASAAGAIVGLYTGVPSVIAGATHFIGFAAFFQIVDAVQAAANGALRGYKDTNGPMLVTVVAYWMFGVPLALLLISRPQIGADGVWIGFIIGLTVASVGLCWRLSHRSNRLPVIQGS